MRLLCDRKPYVVEVENGARIPARTVMIATGTAYRKPQCEKLPRFEGAGVYYAATAMEAQLCQGEEVIVVGGGNGAGQAAVFLADSARRVHMLVRSASLVDKMSRYLIRRIEETTKILFRPYTEIIGLQGGDHLESVRWRNGQTRLTEEHKIRHVFLMTGADPNTGWLNGCITLDSKGFIKTGLDLSPVDLSTAHWPLARQPYLLEANLPGVFAMGDVRLRHITLHNFNSVTYVAAA
jgi:thioredoxin reductase (NADPH)